MLIRYPEFHERFSTAWEHLPYQRSTEYIVSGRKILVAENKISNAAKLSEILTNAGYEVDIARDGKEAFSALKEGDYDGLFAAWMMPRMDGIELIRQVRASITPVPVIIVITQLGSFTARQYGIDSGADDFLAEPYRLHEIPARLGNLLSRRDQPVPKFGPISAPTIGSTPPMAGVCIAAGSGGPSTLNMIIRNLQSTKNASFFIVQHGSGWAVRDMTNKLGRYSSMTLRQAEDDMCFKAGEIYVAPGDSHMTVDAAELRIRLLDDPPENFLKPSADPLFRSIAQCFGRKSIGVILTGMGCDGIVGASYIAAAGGVVIVQDPETAVVKDMPLSVIRTVDSTIVTKLPSIPKTVMEQVERAAENNY